VKAIAGADLHFATVDEGPVAIGKAPRALTYRASTVIAARNKNVEHRVRDDSGKRLVAVVPRAIRGAVAAIVVVGKDVRRAPG
jgi:hypothetical protein